MNDTHITRIFLHTSAMICLTLLLGACAGTKKSASTMKAAQSGPPATQGTAVQVGLIDSLASLVTPEVRPTDEALPPKVVSHPMSSLVKNGRLIETGPNGNLRFEPLTRQNNRPAPGMLEDAAIASKTRGRFAAREGLGRDRIKVESDRGVVTLDGVVDDPVIVARAVDLALEVPNVVQVYSRIRVIPLDPSSRG